MRCVKCNKEITTDQKFYYLFDGEIDQKEGLMIDFETEKYIHRDCL